MEKMSISYSLINAKLSKNVAQLREQINDVSSEAVTGKRADLSKFLSGRIGEAMLSQKALEDIQVDRGAPNHPNVASLEDTRRGADAAVDRDPRTARVLFQASPKDAVRRRGRATSLASGPRVVSRRGGRRVATRGARSARP